MTDINISSVPAGMRIWVLGWQIKLHRWAAEDEDKRFGDLFNLLCDPATLVVAWERVKQAAASARGRQGV